MQNRRHILRFSLTFLTLILCLIVFAVKLILIQVFQSEHLAELAKKQHNYLIEIEPIRGTIYDRNLIPLAFNVSVDSLFANPKMMSTKAKEDAVKLVSPLLGVDPQYIEKLLAKEKYFVWIQRKIPLELSQKIKDLKISGLGFRKESKRYYPNNSMAAHIIGFAGIDNQGLEGLELYYNEQLKGKAGQTHIIRDARQRELLIEKNYISPEQGVHLILTIDETIQYLAERALDKAFQKYKAQSATIIVMDVRTGEILALANRPTYDLGDVGNSSLESRTNRAVSYVYEPGSVFKIVAVTAALEEERFKETDMIFCENGEYRIANHILHDSTSHGKLSFQQVFELSSNIGVAKIAQELGPDLIYKYAHRFRFGMVTGIDLKGEVGGVLKHPRTWSKTSIGAIPMGHEVLTTPLQLVAALAAIANDGVYMKPYVVKYIKNSDDQVLKAFYPEVVDRVMTPNTSKRVRDILVGVVDHGTGTRAQIKGIKVGGKTGTAQKVINGVYSHSKFFATFIGFAPADDPRLAAIVVLDDPQPQHYGGTVAAPVFKEVIENALKYLQTSYE